MEVDPKPPMEGDDGNALTDGVLGDLASSIPGIDEAFSFAEILKQVNSLTFDVVVFDTAPTGHTLRLLALPSTLDKGLEKVLGLQARLGGMLERVARRAGVPGCRALAHGFFMRPAPRGAAPQPRPPRSMMGSSAGGESIFVQLRELRTAVAAVNAQFCDASRTTFVCVAIPEFLSLWETERLVQELAKSEIDVNTVIVNQVIYPGPADAGSPLLGARVNMQKKYLEQFEDLYEDFHLASAPAVFPQMVRVQDGRVVAVSVRRGCPLRRCAARCRRRR